MQGISFLLACITSEGNTALTENSSSLKIKKISLIRKIK